MALSIKKELQKTLSDLSEEFETKRKCPVSGCKSQYKYINGYKAHLSNKHSWEEDQIEEAVNSDEKVRVRHGRPIKCPLCKVTTEKVWERRDHLKRHLSTTHKLGDERVQMILENLLENVSITSIELELFFSSIKRLLIMKRERVMNRVWMVLRKDMKFKMKMLGYRVSLDRTSLREKMQQ